MVHIHHSQPLKIKFGTNHFLGSETFGPIQYREGVKDLTGAPPFMFRLLQEHLLNVLTEELR